MEAPVHKCTQASTTQLILPGQMMALTLALGARTTCFGDMKLDMAGGTSFPKHTGQADLQCYTFIANSARCCGQLAGVLQVYSLGRG